MELKRVGRELLRPIPENAWESRAVFNPAAIREGDYVHLLYRAVEGENFSTVGYAKLNKNGDVLERSNEPVLKREFDWEKQGVEDPRVTKLGDTYYILYSAYDGKNVRICLAVTKDFRTYTKKGIVGPNAFDKDAMLFPEEVNGKIVFMHRIEPNIQLAYFDSIEHFMDPGKNFWKNHLEELDKHTIMTPQYEWESEKVGGGAPPVKTRDGWIIIYHGVDRNLVYRAGAALLDLNNPSKLIARIPYPILEPERKFEKIGDVHNVVFPEGTVVFDDVLYIYYGGADSVTCLAKVGIDELLTELKKYPV